LPLNRAYLRFASVFAALVAVGLAGCADRAQVFQDNNESWFTRPFLATPDWAKPDSISRTANLGPTGPVGPNEMVSADGRCALAAAPETPPPQPPADRPVGSMAGDLAGAPMPAGAAPAPEPGTPLVAGGIALGMTECQTVRRAGTPSNVSVGVGENGGRSVVLTYQSGPWPAIYRFADGRLKVIDRVAAPPPPPKAPPKKKAGKKPAKKPPAQQQ
jgi:hypothetical protein